MPMDHLALYLTNRCNLQCSYCYVSVNQGPAEFLDFEELRASVDYFFRTVPPTRGRKITFIGGEPLLNFALLTRIVEYVRKTGGPDVVLQTFTNGTLVTPEKIEFLRRQNVHVTVSLDGKKEINDEHRVFHAKGKGSVFDEAMRRLKDVPKDNLGVSLVFTSKTVDRLLENVDYFYRMGFWRITFNPEYYEPWPQDRLRAMEIQLDGLARYYRKILDSGKRPFQIQILFAVLENKVPENLTNCDSTGGKPAVNWWHDCHNMVTGPDGKFYGCDKALTFPIGEAKENQIGSPMNGGMDMDKRRKMYDEAIGFIESKGLGDSEAFCPMGVYFNSRLGGEDPLPALKNFSAVSNTFTVGLKKLIAACEDHPTYKDIYVRASVV